ncbi:hypothetical protein ACWEIJ_44270 [Lentzea sp. NPDC004789]
MNISPDIPQLDPMRLQVRKHALVNEISAKPSRRWWRFTVPATALVAAVVTTLVLWTPTNPSAYASWTAEPRAPGPDVDAMIADCREQLAKADRNTRTYFPNWPATPTEVSVIDQRGDLTLIVFTGPEAVHDCLRGRKGSYGGGGGGIAPLGADRYRAMTYGAETGDGAGQESRRTLIARASPEVARVRVNTEDGRHVAATLGKDGWLAAWWPGEADVTTVTLYDRAGHELGTEPGGVR